MSDEHTNITVRVPAELRERLQALAEAESKRTGLRVDISSVVRRALVLDLEKREAVQE